MNIRLLKKKLLLGISAIVLAVMVACPWVDTVTVYQAVTAPTVIGAGVIMPRSAIIEWRYKAVNRKLYRRQYNYTEQCWIGEWELCP